MKNDIFFSAPCLSDELPPIRAAELLKMNGFKQNVDRRYMSQALHKFLDYNRDCLEYLGVKAHIHGIDPNVELFFETGPYIGAIPLRMPGTGKQAGDLLVYPRFSGSEDKFANLARLLMMMEDMICPEFMDSIPLASGTIVRPPLYYDAISYVELYEKAFKYYWRKFSTQLRTYPYPKSNTNWMRYIQNEYDPANKFKYPVLDSVLTLDHLEWQQLRYVFDLAYQEIMSVKTPGIVRYRMQTKLDTLKQNSKDIKSQRVNHFAIRAVDPVIIKQLKEQANILLGQHSNEAHAWRIDISQLFERYTQYLVKQVALELPIRVIQNGRFNARGNTPPWGIRYIEPDILAVFENSQIAFDAKYKSHFYNLHRNTASLHEAHRADLHQLLAYCSFSRDTNKAGILFYPTKECGYRELDYYNNLQDTRNTVILFGVPFEPDSFMETRQILKKVIEELFKRINSSKNSLEAN